MSRIAVKIKYNTASSPPPYSWTEVDFYEYEVLDTPILSGRSSLKKRLGNGAPKIIKRPGFGSIAITFKLSDYNILSTLTKLQSIEQWEGDDQRFVIYPLYQTNPDIVRICVMETGQVPDAIGIAGYNKYGETLTVMFDVKEAVGTVIPEEEV